MKTVMQLLLVMLVFGGVSAVATLFWQKQRSELQTAVQRAEAAESKIAGNPLAGLEKPVEPSETPDKPDAELPEPPVAVRPPYVEGVDETSPLVVSLNQRLRATHDKERKLDERQEALKLIFYDIRTEQTKINKLRQQLSEEVGKSSQSVREAMKAAQDERELLRQELDSLRLPSKSETDDASSEKSTSPIPSAQFDNPMSVVRP